MFGAKVRRMTEATDDHVAERAGVGRRVFAVLLGVTVAGFGAVAPWLVETDCRWVGWMALGVIVPGGCGTVFLGARGRADDLREFTPVALAGGVVGAAVAAVAAVLIGLLAVLW